MAPKSFKRPAAATMKRPTSKRPAVSKAEAEEDVFQDSESEHTEVFFGIISIECVCLDF